MNRSRQIVLAVDSALLDEDGCLKLIERTKFIEDISARAFVIYVALDDFLPRKKQAKRRKAWDYLIHSDRPDLQRLAIFFAATWNRRTSPISRREILYGLKPLLRSREPDVRDHALYALRCHGFRRILGQWF